MKRSGRQTASHALAAASAAIAAVYTAGLPAIVAPPVFLGLPVLSMAAKPAPQPIVWKDGTWVGWGSCRHGDIEVTVIVKDGHIQSASISKCQTRYSCRVISALPPEVAQRQNPDKIDSVTGATESANAFYYAVVDALKRAK
jgi:uncharacterized protein with FMN-binding domain